MGRRAACQERPCPLETSVEAGKQLTAAEDSLEIGARNNPFAAGTAAGIGFLYAMIPG